MLPPSEAHAAQPVLAFQLRFQQAPSLPRAKIWTLSVPRAQELGSLVMLPPPLVQRSLQAPQPLEAFQTRCLM